MNTVNKFSVGESVLTVAHGDTDQTIESVFHEIFEIRIYESSHCRIRTGDTVIDGGAHYGLFTLYAALAGAAEILCFEPDPRTRFELQWTVTRNLVDIGLSPTVQYYDHALWDSDGIIEFRPAKEASAGSRVVMPGLRKKIGDVFVGTMALDSLNLPKVDVVKLDIEGCELQAIIGMEKTIKRCRPKLMISLYHHSQDMVRIPKLIETYGMKYKCEISDAVGKHVTGFFY